MKHWILAVLFLTLPGIVAAAEYLEQVESDVYQTKGTVPEITKRAKACIAQLVRNDEVRISDSAANTGPINFAMGPGHSGGVEGGAVIVDADLEGGTITANNRVDYTAMMIAHNVKSTMTFMAKEGRFKIRHTNIEYLQKSTGSMHNDGYTRVGKWWGSGWKDAEAALQGVSAKVAACVQNGPAKGDW